MAVKKFKPTSAGVRFQTKLDFKEISPVRPEKSLTVGLRSTGGRNNQGKLTSRFMGGGHKRLYRIIDFRRDKMDIPARVAAIEYDPNRTARIALLHYVDGEKRYILAPNGLAVGARVVAGPSADRCASPPARCARSTSSATPRSARSATSSTRTSRSGRRAATAGWASSPTCAASR